MLGSAEVVDGLGRSQVWLADGTFKVSVPALLFQLYSIHFSFGSGINPAAVYCLLPNKQQATYSRVLTELKRLVPMAAPNVILTDFETAAMSAFSEAYPTRR